MAEQKNFRITYRPFPTSTVEASDVVITAADADEAKAKFDKRYDQWDFVSAKEEL